MNPDPVTKLTRLMPRSAAPVARFARVQVKPFPFPPRSSRLLALRSRVRSASLCAPVLLAALLTQSPVAAHASTPGDREWPQWRGPLSTGVSPDAQPPLTWSETNHVRWKIEIPGKGHSSPIISGDRIYLTSAVPVGQAVPPVYDRAPGTHDNVPVTHRHQFIVIAVDRADGHIAWQTQVKEEFPHEGGHATGSLASNSPTTDGERVYAFFGSRGLYCLDAAGRIVWTKDLGRMNTLHAHGEGSSPVLYQDWLIICWDHEGDSFLTALDKRTGAERWKVARDEKTAWATPLIVNHAGKTQIVASATKRVRGYDLTTGSLLWECAGLTDNVVSSPIYSQGMIIAGNSYYRQAMVAIRLDGAAGDLTQTDHVAWRMNRLTPYVSSPLLYDQTLYFLRHNQNVLSRLDPATGKPRGEPLRLDAIGDFIFASPVGAANRIYITARDGTTVVISHGDENRILAANRLDESFSATPALAGKDLVLRGERFLYRIAD